MNHKIIITCALTGAGDTVGKNPHVPVTPAQIAAAAVEAAIASQELANRNLEAEQTKFANGLSTNFQVLQIQDDLAAAEQEMKKRFKIK